MEDTLLAISGYLGAVLTSACWLPQIYKSLKTRRLDDLSWALLGIMMLGTLFWLTYGLYLADPAIIGANSFVVLCMLALSVMKLTFK